MTLRTSTEEAASRAAPCLRKGPTRYIATWAAAASAWALLHAPCARTVRLHEAGSAEHAHAGKAPWMLPLRPGARMREAGAADPIAY